MKVALEQYPTDPELAASVALTALEQGDMGCGKTVVDLGCGTGILAIACALLDCSFVLDVDCDQEAIAQATANVSNANVQDTVSFLCVKVNSPSSIGNECLRDGLHRVERKPNKRLNGRTKHGQRPDSAVSFRVHY
jgi:rRNA N6-adenosine-methyltransferase METTL5